MICQYCEEILSLSVFKSRLCYTKNCIIYAISKASVSTISAANDSRSIFYKFIIINYSINERHSSLFFSYDENIIKNISSYTYPILSSKEDFYKNVKDFIKKYEYFSLMD